MSTTPDPITWARNEAGRLRTYQITQNERISASIGDIAPAIDFLRKYAGEGSSFKDAANEISEAGVYRAWLHPHNLADLLEHWCTYFETGLTNIQPFEVRARIVAATDIMDFVADLIRDRESHPAAPIVLAGAALEERLRALMDQIPLTPSGKGLDAYGADLKKAGVISAQEGKQITSWAGLRNQAAHGENLDRLTIESATIMADGINLFLQVHDLPTS